MIGHAFVGGWRPDWRLNVGLLLCATVYIAGARRGRRPWPWPRTASFLAGLAVLAVALQSGIDSHAEQLLSIHMVQHLLLWIVAAPLIAASAPVRMAFRVLNRPGRRALGRLLHARWLQLVTHPATAALLFTAVTALSHLPSFYELTLRNPVVHAAEHGAYFWTGVLFWAGMLGVDPLPHRAGAVGRVTWMMVAMTPMVLIGTLLADNQSVVYASYLAPARALGRSALADQSTAGQIMAIGAAAPGAIAILALFAGALFREERHARAREAYAASTSAARPPSPPRPRARGLRRPTRRARKPRSDRPRARHAHARVASAHRARG